MLPLTSVTSCFPSGHMDLITSLELQERNKVIDGSKDPVNGEMTGFFLCELYHQNISEASVHKVWCKILPSNLTSLFVPRYLWWFMYLVFTCMPGESC